MRNVMSPRRFQAPAGLPLALLPAAALTGK
jgi:hypothetical protein